MLLFIIFNMNCIIWNVIGIGNEAFLARVKKFSGDHNLSCSCLLEPLIEFSKLPNIARQRGFDNFFCETNGKIWIL